MSLIFIIIFVGVFTVAALLFAAVSAGAFKEKKQTIATLDSAIATTHVESRDLMIDLRKKENLGALPFINQWLHKIKLAPRLQTILAQANLKWTAGGMMIASASILVFVGYLVYLKTRTVLLSMGIGIAFSLTPLFYVLRKRSKRFIRFEQELPDALELMVSALRVGHSLNAAMGLVTREAPEPIRGEFRIAYDEQNYGLELRVAMDHLTARIPLQDLKIVATAILIQKESGGNLAEVLDKTAHVIRERFRLKRQIMTHTAQGRLTGWILSLLPVVLGIALYFVNPETMSILWTRSIGVKLLYLSGCMTLVGTLIINQIVKMDV